MYLQYECKKPVSLAPALKLYNQPAIGAEWLFRHRHRRQQPVRGRWLHPQRRRVRLAEPAVPLRRWRSTQRLQPDQGAQLPDARRLDASPSRGRIHALEGPARTSEHPVQLHVARAGLARIPRGDPHHPRDLRAAGAGPPAAARSRRAVHCRPTRRSMHSCASMPKPPTTRRARTRWAMLMTRWRWSMARVACTAWKPPHRRCLDHAAGGDRQLNAPTIMMAEADDPRPPRWRSTRQPRSAQRRTNRNPDRKMPASGRHSSKEALRGLFAFYGGYAAMTGHCRYAQGRNLIHHDSWGI